MKTGRGWVATRPSQTRTARMVRAALKNDPDFFKKLRYTIQDMVKAAVPKFSRPFDSEPEAKKRKISNSLEFKPTTMPAPTSLIETFLSKREIKRRRISLSLEAKPGPSTSAGAENNSGGSSKGGVNSPSTKASELKPATSTRTIAPHVPIARLQKSSHLARDVLKALGWIEEVNSDKSSLQVALRMKRAIPAVSTPFVLSFLSKFQHLTYCRGLRFLFPL